MRAPLIAIVLSSVGRAVCAQPADEGSKMLDTCFELARAADATCSDQKNGAAERMDCRQKASMAQLECLERVFPGRSAGSFPPEIPAGSVSPERPFGTVAKGGPTSSQKTPPGTGPPETSTAAASPEMTTGTSPPGAPARRVDIPAKPQDTDWIVSETTSPVDYSPLVTAVIRSTTSLQDAPNTLVIRCLGPRTEVRFARKEHGAHLAPAKFKSTIRSTTNRSLGCNGLRPQMERQLVTETMPSGFFSRYRKARD